MERFLSAVAMVNQAAAEAGVGVAGESLLGTIKIAVLPIAKVFTMCFLGFLMASKYVNILPASGRKLLNGLVFSLLLPCLIFSQLGQAITIEKMLEWWFIPMNVILGSMSGSLIGFIVASLVRPPYPFFKFSIIQIGIGNIGNVPLVLIAALCRDKSNPFGDSEKCSTDGTAYISFGQWVGAIILYTYVFHMLAPPPGGTFDIEDGNLPIKDPPKEATAEQLPLLTHEEAASVNSTASANLKEEHQPTASEKGKVRTNRYPSTTVSVRKCVATATIMALEKCFPYYLKLLLSCVFGDKFKGFFFFLYEKLKLKQILQPPIIASILAMLLGAVPFFKQLIFTADAPFFFFTDSCIILGEAMIPCILLALGGNLVDGPGSSKLGLRTTAAIIFARLVLVPPAGLGIVMLADKLGFLPAGDKMFRFVLLLQHTMPTSVLAGAVANLRGCGREAAAVLFWVHIFAVISMSGWIVLYLNILF